MTYDAAKIIQNTIKLCKNIKKILEMIAPTLLKALFKFLSTLAEQKSQRLIVILLWLSSGSNV